MLPLPGGKIRNDLQRLLEVQRQPEHVGAPMNALPCSPKFMHGNSFLKQAVWKRPLLLCRLALGDQYNIDTAHGIQQWKQSMQCVGQRMQDHSRRDMVPPTFQSLVHKVIAGLGRGLAGMASTRSSAASFALATVRRPGFVHKLKNDCARRQVVMVGMDKRWPRFPELPAKFLLFFYKVGWNENLGQQFGGISSKCICL